MLKVRVFGRWSAWKFFISKLIKARIGLLRRSFVRASHIDTNRSIEEIDRCITFQAVNDSNGGLPFILIECLFLNSCRRRRHDDDYTPCKNGWFLFSRIEHVLCGVWWNGESIGRNFEECERCEWRIEDHGEKSSNPHPHLQVLEKRWLLFRGRGRLVTSQYSHVAQTQVAHILGPFIHILNMYSVTYIH